MGSGSSSSAAHAAPADKFDGAGPSSSAINSPPPPGVKRAPAPPGRPARPPPAGAAGPSRPPPAGATGPSRAAPAAAAAAAGGAAAAASSSSAGAPYQFPKASFERLDVWLVENKYGVGIANEVEDKDAAMALLSESFVMSHEDVVKLKQAKDRLLDVANEVPSLKQQVAALEAAAAAGSVAAAQAQASSKEAALQAEIDKLKATITGLSAAKAAEEARASSASSAGAEVAALKKDNSKLQDEKRSQTNKLAAVQAENLKLKEEALKQNEEMRALQEQVATLNVALSSLESSRNNSRSGDAYDPAVDFLPGRQLGASVAAAKAELDPQENRAPRAVSSQKGAGYSSSSAAVVPPIAGLGSLSSHRSVEGRNTKVNNPLTDVNLAELDVPSPELSERILQEENNADTTFIDTTRSQVQTQLTPRGTAAEGTAGAGGGGGLVTAKGGTLNLPAASPRQQTPRANTARSLLGGKPSGGDPAVNKWGFRTKPGAKFQTSIRAVGVASKPVVSARGAGERMR